MNKVEGNLVDIHNREIYPAEIFIDNGKIISINKCDKKFSNYICTGLVDAHVHIESSMLMPSEFAKIIIPNGTIAVVTDPHEIANVLGIDGIMLMINDSENSPLKCFWGIPSCVPATRFDISGSKIDSRDVEKLAQTGKFTMLSEVMDIDGILNDDKELLRKIEIAKKYNLKIDGHAPSLSGESLNKYVSDGMQTDHEVVNYDEALEKISSGMFIMIREGSAAKSYDKLKELISSHPDKVMFCTDDSHPNDIIERGHINYIVKKAINDGFDIFDILKIASYNPVSFYNLNVGLLKEGDSADFIIVDNLNDFNILSTYIQGIKYTNTLSINSEKKLLNKFNHDFITEKDLLKKADKEVLCIEVIPESLITNKYIYHTNGQNESLESDFENDILKIVYINRYNNSKPQIGYVKGFNLKRGAFASSISHDSHNIIAVGTNDKDICDAVNEIVKDCGGLSIIDDDVYKLALPIAGIISDKTGVEVSEKFNALNDKLFEMGCNLESPFMTLSFLSLIVIPYLKIGEKGYFDFNKSDFI